MILQIGIISISWKIALMYMPQNTSYNDVNIGSGNGLVPSGNKALPVPMLTQICLTTWCHKASVS